MLAFWAMNVAVLPLGRAAVGRHWALPGGANANEEAAGRSEP